VWSAPRCSLSDQAEVNPSLCDISGEKQQLKDTAGRQRAAQRIVPAACIKKEKSPQLFFELPYFTISIISLNFVQTECIFRKLLYFMFCDV